MGRLEDLSKRGHQDYGKKKDKEFFHREINQPKVIKFEALGFLRGREFGWLYDKWGGWFMKVIN
jgi:hypothetical protein